MQDYLAYWGVDHPIFAGQATPEKMFVSARLKTQLERILLACSQEQPLIVITGEPGSGKSTALKWIFHHLEPAKYDVVLTALVHKERQAGWLAPRLAELFGVNSQDIAGATAGELIRQVARHLDEILVENRRLVVVVDAAHFAEAPPAFDEIITLFNLQALAGAKSCLTFVLCGGDALLKIIDQTPELAARLAYHAALPRLTRDETAAYLHNRLQAGGISDVFDDGAIDFIHMKARGIFAAINTCADSCLMEAYQQGLRHVRLETAQAATGYLGTRELVEARRPAPRSPKPFQPDDANMQQTLVSQQQPIPAPPGARTPAIKGSAPAHIKDETNPKNAQPPTAGPSLGAAKEAKAPKETKEMATNEKPSIKLSSLFKSDVGQDDDGHS